jgi:hypothetical protein
MDPASAIRWADAQGVVVLLDLRTAQYVALGERASAMWRALVAGADRSSAELAEFAERCVARGYLAPEPPAPAAAPLRAPRAGWPLAPAWWSLAATARRLARRGFPETYRAYAALRKPHARPDPRALGRAQRAFTRAENAFVLRSSLRDKPRDCLPRSLALYRFLLARGIAADHVIGVTMYPFTAHAWVECGGEAVCDSTEAVRAYTPIARL